MPLIPISLPLGGWATVLAGIPISGNRLQRSLKYAQSLVSTLDRLEGEPDPRNFTLPSTCFHVKISTTCLHGYGRREVNINFLSIASAIHRSLLEKSDLGNMLQSSSCSEHRNFESNKSFLIDKQAL